MLDRRRFLSVLLSGAAALPLAGSSLVGWANRFAPIVYYSSGTWTLPEHASILTTIVLVTGAGGGS